MSIFQAGQHIHLVGVGGAGISAIARILLERGYRVSGSDRNSNAQTESLARDGATIYHGHDAANVQGADMLIITSAVHDDHVEVAAALAAGIPVYKRQDIMADLMAGQKVIAVAGTKGKTTTTAMIVHLLRESGVDPSYIVGGVLGNTGTNAGVGKGEWFVVEADEYDNMFLGLRPNIIVLTNIEWDHPDFFKSPDAMVSSFRRFVRLLPPDGWLIACSDDANAQKLASERLNSEMDAIEMLRGREVVGKVGEQIAGQIHTGTYGVLQPGRFDLWLLERRRKTYHWVWWADHLEAFADGAVTFEFDRPGDISHTVTMNLPGSHNILNAVGALAAVYQAAPDQFDVKPLASFQPTARRFDLRGDINGVAVVDDYAHNPMSIRAVLEAARMRYAGRKVWAVWQPHTYSRTQALFVDFTKAFAQADHVLVTDIYAARENPLPGVDSASVVAAMQTVHHSARHTASFADTVAVLKAEVLAPAVIIIMSAGDAPEIGVEYIQHLRG